MKNFGRSLVQVSVDDQMEWELIRQCRGGRTASFEPLVRNHQARALAIAEALLGNTDDAAEAVQEAFVKAYRALGRLRDGSAFGPWFRSIVRNQCRDRLRVARPLQQSLTDTVVDGAVWSEPRAQVAVERKQLAAAVRAALATLSKEHREILVLKEMEEMSYAEIAEAMQIPPGTVASRLYHARAALRVALERRGFAVEGAANR